MGYRRVYEVYCDAPECTATEFITSERNLPSIEYPNPVPPGWSKLRDTDSGLWFSWCPQHNGAKERLPVTEPAPAEQEDPESHSATTAQRDEQELEEGVTLGYEPIEGVPHCEICGKPQELTPSGPVCENGHGGARGTILEGGIPIEALFGDPPEQTPTSTIDQALQEDDQVFALLSDGRILVKAYESTALARAAAEQILRVKPDPEKLLSWFEWSLVEDAPHAG